MGTESVKVCVRCRPFNEREKKQGCKSCVKVSTKRGEVIMTKPGTDFEKTFTYDAVYGINSTQLEVYKDTALPVVDSVLQGYNGTVFAYGQTGAGKTFTMEGIPTNKGLIPNAFEHIFHTIKEESKDKQFLVRASMLEIYNEDIRDLLGKDSKKSLKLKENPDRGVYVKGLKSSIVKTVEQIDAVMAAGKKNRSTASTLMNATSSRSHCIFLITVETIETIDGEEHVRVGKLNMVDLAGSERANKTGATGDRLKEGCKINLSLSALGNVISALVDKKSLFVPYRDSKLTRLLQDSLGGNTKTVMMANFSPADDNYDETLSTLRYASRAKKIQNRPKINEDPKDAMIRAFQEQIAELRAKLTGKVLDENGDPIDKKKLEEQKIKKLMEENEAEKQVLVQSMREKTEKEKEELMKRKNEIEQRKRELAENLERKQQELEKEREEKRRMAEQLKRMEGHVVRGGKTLLERHKEHELEIRKQKQELLERRKKEIELKREIQAKKEKKLAVEEKYDSIQEEIDLKTRKLKKLWKHYQNTKREIDELHSDFQRERDDFLFTSQQLERDLKLKISVIDTFIPREEVTKIMNRAHWDESLGDWIISPPVALRGGQVVAARRPQSACGLKRPMSEYAMRQASRGGVRFKYDNIIDLDLEMHSRTTEDWDANAEIEESEEEDSYEY